MNTSAEKKPVSIRHALKAGDAAAVEQLVKETGFFTPAEVAVAKELVEETLARGASAGYAFVLADLEGSLAGYACYGEIPATERRFDLYWIAVSPRYQRMGIGARILAEVETAIAGLKGRAVYIETSSKPKYKPTRTFYTASGYRLAAKLTNFYRDGDSKLIYEKWF